MKTTKLSALVTILLTLGIASPGWAATVEVYNQTFTGQQLDDQVNLGNASYPSVDFATVVGSSLDLSPIAGDGSGTDIVFRMPIIEPGALGCLEDLVITITVDKTALTSDNDFGVAVSDTSNAIGGMQGDQPRNWSLDSPDIGGRLSPENFSPFAVLSTTQPITYVINVSDLGGPGSQFEVGSAVHAPLQTLDYGNGFDFLLIGNSDAEFYRINSVTIVAEAQNVDSDCDGFSDEIDDCIYSDLSATVMVGDCDTGVTNLLFGNGCTLADLVNDLVSECLDGAKNHGQFVSCVSHGLNSMKKLGLISGKEKGAIQSCVAQSNN